MLRNVLPMKASVLKSGQSKADWHADAFIHKGFNLPYQLYSPPQKGVWPLIVHLHGSGEAGVDNQTQMYSNTNTGPQYFANHENQTIQQAFVLAPQTPESMRWASDSIGPYDFESTPSTPSMSALLCLIDHMIASNPNIDANRIYLCGLSRGGQGVWNGLFQRPDLFAAAIAICGSADPKQAQRIKETPVWVFHGEADDITDVGYSRQMVIALQKSGNGFIRHTEVIGGDHGSAWLATYSTSEAYTWLCQQKGSH